MLIRSLLIVILCVIGCQSKPAAVPPAKSKFSLADKLEAAKAIAAEAKAEYQRQAAKAADYERIVDQIHAVGNEEAIAEANDLYSQQRSRMWDAKREWEDAEQAVQRLAKQIVEK